MSGEWVRGEPGEGALDLNAEYERLNTEYGSEVCAVCGKTGCGWFFCFNVNDMEEA